MVKYLENKSASIVLFVVCFATYSLIGFTRSAYTSAIVGIIDDGIFTKLDAGTISSAFNITYSLVQFVGSGLTDKISPYKIILFALVGTIVANIVMSFSTSFWLIFIARAACGVFQFGTWPALLKIVSGYINKGHRRTAMYIMPLGITVGGILSNIVASVVLNYGRWQDMFKISYIVLIFITIIYILTFAYADKKSIMVESELKAVPEQKEENVKAENISTMKVIWKSGAIFLIIPVLTKSLVASAISNWMPTMIMECYNISPSFSTTLSTISTCANFLAIFWVMMFYPRVIRNGVSAVGIFFIMSIIPLTVLMFIGQYHMAIVVFLIAFVNIQKNAIHQFFTVEIPAMYAKYNKAGTIAGLINAIACLGSVISGIVYGYIAEKFGWGITIASWFILAMLGAIFAFIQAPVWRRFVKNIK